MAWTPSARNASRAATSWAALVAAYTVSGRCSACSFERQFPLVVTAVLLGAPGHEDARVERAGVPAAGHLGEQGYGAHHVHVAGLGGVVGRARQVADARQVDDRVGARGVQRRSHLRARADIHGQRADGAALLVAQHLPHRRPDAGASRPPPPGEQGAADPLADEAGGPGDERAPGHFRPSGGVAVGMSARTIISTSSSNPTVGAQPISTSALVGSATSRSTSAGRKNRGSWTT